MSATSSGSIEFLPTVHRIHHGEGVLAKALAQEVEAAGARQPRAVLSHALQGTDVARVCARVAGEEGLFFGRFEHVPPDAVLEVAAWLEASGADLVIVVGGGSAIDTAKAARFALAARLEAPSDLLPAMARPTPAGPWLPQIAVPTTLSGAEYTRSFSATDLAERNKRSHVATACASSAIVYDPLATVHTPAALWLGSGFVALDHALEVFVTSAPHPVADALKSQAAATLWRELPGSTAADALATRLACQLAGWMVDHSPLRTRASGGSGQPWSHLLAYELAAMAGCGYADTALLTLASSLRLLARDPRCAARQRDLAQRLGVDGPLADGVERFAARLGLAAPRVSTGRLREVAAICAARTGTDEASCREVLGL